MRRIDADALKEDLTKWFPQFTLEGIEPKTLFAQIMRDIDNAPTVEPEITEKQAILLLINNGWLVNHDKELREKWERPKGEWKRRAMNEYLCSNCRYNVSSVESLFYKFCPKCGADMRKGGEES